MKKKEKQMRQNNVKKDCVTAPAPPFMTGQ